MHTKVVFSNQSNVAVFAPGDVIIPTIAGDISATANNTTEIPIAIPVTSIIAASECDPW